MEKVFMLKVPNPFSSVSSLFSDLEKTISGEINCSSEILEKYSRDFSPYCVRPQAVIYPKNTTDIKHVLTFAKEYSLPVTVRGNGNSNTGGSLGEGLILDMTRYFNHVRYIDTEDNTVTLGAGVSVKTLKEKLYNLGMESPVITSQDDTSTIGALLATKSLNTSSFCYGTIREWVKSITVVVDTGEEHRIEDGITPTGRLLEIYQSLFPLLTQEAPMLRASKPENTDDTTGYNLWTTSIGPKQLLNQIIGSEGTFGIITSVTLLTRPRLEESTTLFIPILEKESMTKYIQTAKSHKADSIFMYDATFMELVERYRPLSCPSFKEASYVLCVAFVGKSQEETKRKAEKYIENIHIPVDSVIFTHDEKILEEISEPSFLLSLLDSYTQGTLTPISSADSIIIPHHVYTKALSEIEDYVYSTGKLYVITGNAGSGHISVITLFNQNSQTYGKEIEAYTQSLFSYVKKYKGGISGQGGEGITRTPYLPFIFNEATIRIFTEVKKIWDPSFTLNPGKKLGTNLLYLQNHLSHSKKKL